MAIPPSWVGISNTTTQEYIRQVVENILRNYKLMGYLQDRGRITYGHSGDFMDWKARIKRAPLQGYSDMEVVSFPRRNRHVVAQLPWRGYAATEGVSELDQLKNRGEPAIVKFVGEMATSLVDDVKTNFSEELYIDGEASGNEKKIHGLESIFGNGGASTLAPLMLSDDTYAGLATILGGLGGALGTSAVWPLQGTYDTQYDAWTPVIVDYTSSVIAASGGWTNTTKTFPNTGKEAIRYGIIASQRNGPMDSMINLNLFAAELFRQFKDQLDDNERMVVTRGQPGSGSYSLGFTDMINFDGVDCGWEYGIPPAVIYGLSLQNIEVRCMYDQIFKSHDLFYDVNNLFWKLIVGFFGNMRINPRYQVKWMAH